MAVRQINGVQPYQEVVTRKLEHAKDGGAVTSVEGLDSMLEAFDSFPNLLSLQLLERLTKICRYRGLDEASNETVGSR